MTVLNLGFSFVAVILIQFRLHCVTEVVVFMGPVN